MGKAFRRRKNQKTNFEKDEQKWKAKLVDKIYEVKSLIYESQDEAETRKLRSIRQTNLFVFYLPPLKVI